jgi:prevent-host-death family protein
MKPIGVREMKVHASRVLRRLRETKEEVPITYRGAVVAHLVAAEEYERLKAGQLGYWQALQAFRERHHSSPPEATDALARLRDRSPGRTFRW